MRVLWFSPISFSGKGNDVNHNGGGWIGSLLSRVRDNPSLSLAIAYIGDGVPYEQNGVRFFPIPLFSSMKNRLRCKFSFAQEAKILKAPLQGILANFQPDLIQIFGSENVLGMVCSMTDIPCVIHLQGFLPAYYNALLPPKIGWVELLTCSSKLPNRLLSRLWCSHIFKKRAERESGIVKHCHNFFGRTHWDRAIVSLYNPTARYFYCSEMLRDVFYEKAGQWQTHDHEERVFVSVLSTPLYKGHDVILKTAALLRQHSDLKFRWKAFGGCNVGFWEKLLQISASDVNVEFNGVVTAEQLKDELLQADIFVHPSYIDNSPNSLCEAQLLGLPVIAVNAGGVSSLIENEKTGLLVPANDPIMMAEKLKMLCASPQLAATLGKQGGAVAAVRHDPDRIVKDLLSAYQEILKNKR